MELSSFSVNAMTRRRPLTPLPSRHSLNDNEETSGGLKRTLTLSDLIFYGVGCSVGAGIYSLVGIGADLAGPSIALSFFLCGVACCFTSLSYAEFAARVPLAGSAYVFAYVSFGELLGWLVGWNLTLGYAVSAAVVARSWAEYLVGFVDGFSQVDLTFYLTKLPLPVLNRIFGDDYTCCPLSIVIIGFCTLVLVTGVKESTRFNTAMTILNLSVLSFVLFGGIGSGTVHSDNLHPIFPHGIVGMARGAGLVFFSYLGFDMVSCLSEEVKNPERNMPIGIVGSLLTSMSIYVAVSVVIVGMAPVALLGEDTPITNALLANGCCSHSEQVLHNAENTCLTFNCHPILHPVLLYGSRAVSFGAIFGLTTATFACLMGQPRIFYSMAQDGLLFKIYARVHPKTGVPTVGTVITGICTALVACFVELESLANSISLGTLQVFTFVNAGVIILRMQPTIQPANLVQFPYSDPEKSPLIKTGDLESVVVARSLGLVKQSSAVIRRSLRPSPSFELVAENGNKPVWLILSFTACAILSSMVFSKGWHVGVAMFFCLGCLVSGVLLFSLPKSPKLDTFTCPCVPLIPLLGIVCNSYMMGSLPSSTWSAILAWLLVGLIFYFLYGIHHSELRVRDRSHDDALAELEISQEGSCFLPASYDST